MNGKNYHLSIWRLATIPTNPSLRNCWLYIKVDIEDMLDLISFWLIWDCLRSNVEVSNGTGCHFWPVAWHTKRLGRANTNQQCSGLGRHGPKKWVVLGLKKQLVGPQCWQGCWLACWPTMSAYHAGPLGPFKFHFLLFITCQMSIIPFSIII